MSGWQPWQGGPQSWPPQGAPPSMLASHADRERTVDVLRAGYGEGRLDKEEFDRRVARAVAARTVGELALLVADLPQGPQGLPLPVQPVPPPPHGMPGARPWPTGPFVPAPPPRPTNAKAVGSAVCGALCLPTFGLTGIPAVVLGQAARNEIRRTGESGETLAFLGLVLGWLSVAAWTMAVTLLLAVAIASG